MNMERTDSSAAMASLASYAGESDKSDDEANDDLEHEPPSVDNISDDDEKQPPSVTSSSRPLLTENRDSPGSLPDTTASRSSERPSLGRKATRLVSYGPDDLDEGEASKSESEEGDEGIIVEGRDFNSSLHVDIAASLSRSVRNKSVEEIEIPPEPAGKCAKHLQDKIARLYEKMRREGVNLNASIQRRKDFRNPSIYEKLIQFCEIDEKGTNYPPEVYDPHSWGEESYYTALDKTQKAEMEKREKERKDRTKIEFVVGTKKSCDGVSDEKKRKTKWDSQPVVTGVRPSASVLNPSLVTLTTSATGTKSTIIPASGNITKKPSSGK